MLAGDAKSALCLTHKSVAELGQILCPQSFVVEKLMSARFEDGPISLQCPACELEGLFDETFHCFIDRVGGVIPIGARPPIRHLTAEIARGFGLVHDLTERRHHAETHDHVAGNIGCAR